jgi:hypothetical protein
MLGRIANITRNLGTAAIGVGLMKEFFIYDGIDCNIDVVIILKFISILKWMPEQEELYLIKYMEFNLPQLERVLILKFHSYKYKIKSNFI